MTLLKLEKHLISFQKVFLNQRLISMLLLSGINCSFVKCSHIKGYRRLRERGLSFKKISNEVELGVATIHKGVKNMRSVNTDLMNTYNQPL